MENNVNDIKRIFLPHKKTYLEEVMHMENIMTGCYDVLFCNGFIDESIQLIKNSIFLMEEGYYDCAFYSIRQSSEVLNNMLMCANDKNIYLKWCEKSDFPPDNQVIKKLKKVDEVYSEFNIIFKDFFDNFENYKKKSNKIIHKQGFDTYYKKIMNSKQIDIIHSNYIELYDCFIKYAICKIYFMVVILDPMTLILSIEEFRRKVSVLPLSNPIDLDIFKKFCNIDFLEAIKDSNFYKNISNYYGNKDTLNESTYNVIHEMYFDLENLNDINLQRYLLDIPETIILDILLYRIKISAFYIDGSILLKYNTSIKSKFVGYGDFSNKFEKYNLKINNFNIPYNNIFISILYYNDFSLVLEHNEKLEDVDINKIVRIQFKE